VEMADYKDGRRDEEKIQCRAVKPQLPEAICSRKIAFLDICSRDDV